MFRMTLDQFITKYQGKYWDFDGQYSAQCFDLFQFYNRDVVGAPFVTGASAKDIWNTYPRAFYEQIANGATNYPKKGDVMIWGDKYGPYGHVAICSEDGNPQTDSFTVLSQNDPVGVPSIYKTYSDWKGVLGWIRPKPQVEDPLKACLRQHADLLKQLESANAKCISLQDSISTLNKELLNSRMDTEKALNDLKSANRELTVTKNKLIDIQKILNS
jgi:hypothetical protein